MQPDEIVKEILRLRGITEEEDVREFLSEKPKLTYDSFLLPGAEEGADYLLGVLTRGESVCVYGDYDADGVCGAAMLVLFLREAARALNSESKITYYIPSRTSEGYGLNNEALKTIKDRGANVVVTIDCGSVSVNEAAYARSIGLGLVITDHHDPDNDNLPDCIHVNPKLYARGDSGYPNKMLSGTGVAYKFCGALIRRMPEGLINPSSLSSLIDLVCVATVADVMPLTGENRTFVKYGLSMLRRGRRPAFRALISVSGINPAKLDTRDIGFGLAPRINALGRMEDASEGVEFFLTDDEERIRSIAARMNAFNQNRQRIQEEVVSDCLKLIEPAEKFLWLRPDNAHEGVAGIVAGKIREKTGLPCAVITKTLDDGEELLKGSARGAGRLDLISLLRGHAELFERLGGHSAAAGFSVRLENEAKLRKLLSQDLVNMLAADPGLLDNKPEAELEIAAADVTRGLAEAIESLGPFGQGNEKPLFSITTPVEEIAGIRVIGQDSKHLRFFVGGVQCVYFWGGKTVFPASGTVDILGCPEINEWNGDRNIQFAVKRVDML